MRLRWAVPVVGVATSSSQEEASSLLQLQGARSLDSATPPQRKKAGKGVSWIAVDRSCPDPSAGCNGGCYQWEGHVDFFGNCLQGKINVVDILMQDPIIGPMDSWDQGCAQLGFAPLTQVADGSPIAGGNSVPDACYDGGAGSRVSFFATDQKWFWDTVAGSFHPPVDCPRWQEDNQQCFDAPLRGCEIQFGRGAADPDQVISIVDPTVPALFCDRFNLTAPCTYIHRAQSGTCAPPAPPLQCGKYIRIAYSKCDGLKETEMTMDTADKFDPETGVFKGCEEFVTSTEVTYWAPNKPISGSPPWYPDTYQAIKCSKRQRRQADRRASQRVPMSKKRKKTKKGKSWIAVDSSCPDPSLGCNGGCYQWEDGKDFFGNCMQGKSPVVGLLMQDPVIVRMRRSKKSLGCAQLGFAPLTQVANGSPIAGGSSVPDGCYGGAGSRVSFFTTDQTWFWDTVAGSFNAPVDCPQWQADNQQCFDAVLQG